MQRGEVHDLPRTFYKIVESQTMVPCESPNTTTKSETAIACVAHHTDYTISTCTRVDKHWGRQYAYAQTQSTRTHCPKESSLSIYNKWMRQHFQSNQGFRDSGSSVQLVMTMMLWIGSVDGHCTLVFCMFYCQDNTVSRERNNSANKNHEHGSVVTHSFRAVTTELYQNADNVCACEEF